jgi:pantetheine-phosphate adenylyltransferase
MAQAAERPVPDRPPRVAVYAGVFDPPTLAHLEIVETALTLFDRVIVVVAFNPEKPRALFTPEERVELFRASLTDAMRPYVEVEAHGGLTAKYAERRGACALIRGMRPYADADSEIALALMNQKLAPKIPTLLLVTSARNVYLSSSFVRDTATLGHLIVSGSVPPPVEAALRRRFSRELDGPAAAAEGQAG